MGAGLSYGELAPLSGDDGVALFRGILSDETVSAQATGLEVRSGLAVSYASLPPELQLPFRRIGLLPTGDFAAWTLGALTGWGDGEREVERLVAAGLLDPAGVDGTGEARYRPRDLVALFARERAADEDEAVTRAAVERLLDAMLHFGSAIHGRVARISEGLPPDALPGDVVAPPTDVRRLTADPHAWLRAERRQLLGVIEQACRMGLVAKAALLADQVVPALEQFGLDQLRSVRANVRDAALAADDEATAWRSEYGRGELVLSERVDEAAESFARCADAFRRLGRARELVYSLTGLAFARATQGMPAGRYVEEATRVARNGTDRYAEALTTRTHAEILIMRERPAEALALLEKALRRTHVLENAAMRRMCLARIADCALSLGDVARAAAAYGEALRLVDGANNPRGLAWLLLLRTRIQLAEADPAGAIATGQRAHALMAAIGDARGEATAVLRLAEAYLHAADPRRAKSLLEQCLPTLNTTNVRVRTALAEDLLAKAHRDLARQQG